MANWVALRSLQKGSYVDGAGNVLSAHSVNVYLRGTTTGPTIAPNANGTGTPLTQPLTTDSNGDVPGYVQSALSVDFVDVSTGVRQPGEAISAGDILNQSNIPVWAASTPYTAGYVVQQSNILYVRNTTGTSTSSWSTDQANWTPLTTNGTELAYRELTTGSFSVSATKQLITGCSFTIVAPPFPVMIEGDCYSFAATSSGFIPLLEIQDGSGTPIALGTGGSVPNGSSSASFAVRKHYKTTDWTVGNSYTFSLYTWSGGTGTLSPGTTSPVHFRAVQC